MSKEQAIFKAAQSGNFVLFKENIHDQSFKELVFTSCHQKSGDTALHYAVRHGHLELVKFLINAGFNLETGNFDGKRPLHEAAQFGQRACLEYLLTLNGNVDVLKRGDWTPLMLACTKDNLSVIQLLVEHGASLNLRNKDGWNCFHIAVREGHLPIVKYLLEQEPSLWNTVSKNGRTPLHTAALHGHTEVLDYLLEKCHYGADIKDSCGSTPFMDAVRVQDIQAAKLLISKHMNKSAVLVKTLDFIRAPGSEQQKQLPVVHLAETVTKKFSLEKFLIILEITDHKADVMMEDNLGRQALHIAAQTGAVKAMKYLVSDCGVDPVATCPGNGASALHIAAKEGHVEVIQTLLDFGVSSNLTDTKGRTALHIAAGAQHADCVRALFQHDADCRLDLSGTSPKKLAVKQEVLQVFEEFENT